MRWGRLPAAIVRARAHTAIVVACAAGIALRLYQLPGQIPYDDEWHALVKAHTSGYADILTSFGINDYSIPLAVYFKLLMDTIGMSDWGLRAPFLLAGAVTPLVLSLLLRPHIGPLGAGLMAWLLAVSPLLVYFSRTARPYALTLLLGFAAVLLAYRWWTTRGRAAALSYVLLAGLTAWLHLVTLPFVCAPLPVLFLLSVFDRTASVRQALARLVPIVLLTLLFLLVLLGPPLYGDFRAIAFKAAQEPIPLSTLMGALAGMLGAENRIVTTVLALLAVAGVVRLCHTDRRFACYLLLAGLAQLLGLFVARPLDARYVLIFEKYSLLVLPILLVLVSLGIALVLSWLRAIRYGLVRDVVFLGLAVVLFQAGPLPHLMQRPNNALTLGLAVRIGLGLDDRDLLARVPEFYRQLGQLPPSSVTLVEAPARLIADHVPFYQRVHRQQIVTGAVTRMHLSGEQTDESELVRALNLPSVVDVCDVRAMFASGARYLVFHPDLSAEIPFVLRGVNPRYLSQCIEEYRDLLGDPVVDDGALIVFSLPAGR